MIADEPIYSITSKITTTENRIMTFAYATVSGSNLLIEMNFLFMAPYAGAISKNLGKKSVKSIYSNRTPLRLRVLGPVDFSPKTDLTH